MPRHDGRKRVTQKTRVRRQELVRDSTFPEQLLWSKLRAKQLGGLKFRRQHPIEPYIVDFYCASEKIAIELDGRTHDDQQDYDRSRTDFISAQGVKLIRFSNDEVLANLDGVLEAIAEAVGASEK